MATATKQERWAAWYAANREAVLAKKRAYRQRNKKKISTYNASYREKNPAKIKQYATRRLASGRAREAVDKYQAKNKDKVRQSGRRWRDKNPEYHSQYHSEHKVERAINERKWRESNPDRSRAKVRNRRARLRNAKGQHGADDIADIYKLQRGLCAHPWCRSELGRKYHVDHITALANGGRNDRSNLQILCAPCNQKKHTKDAITVARANGYLI